MKSRLTNLILKSFFSLVTAMALGLGAGCEGTIHASGTVAFYDYFYYPDWDVYYYPRTQVYFWNDGRRWRSGHSVPMGFQFNVSSPRRSLRVQTSQPWTANWPDQPRFRYHYPPRHW